jgi:hypothetical protein
MPPSRFPTPHPQQASGGVEAKATTMRGAQESLNPSKWGEIGFESVPKQRRGREGGVNVSSWSHVTKHVTINCGSFTPPHLKKQDHTPICRFYESHIVLCFIKTHPP